MFIHHNRSARSPFIITVIVFVTFACNFITGAPPTATATATAAAALPTNTSVPSQPLLSPNSIPMPGGLILKSATDTERALSGYTVPYLEDQADGFAGANQSEIDMYFAEDHEFTIRALSSRQPMIWTTGWCAQGQEILHQNLEKIQFEMSVNGQLVDLNKVYRSDNIRSWHTEGNYCLFYRLIVDGWTSETTTFRSKTILREPVHDGTKEYPAGEFTRTYQVTNPIEVMQIPNSFAGGPILGSIEETRKAQEDQVETLVKAAEEQYSSETPVGETRKYTIYVPHTDKRLMWFHGWCATDNMFLVQNLNNMKFELQINGQSVDLNRAVSNDYETSTGMHCFSYSIMMYGWPSDSTVLTSKIIFLKPIHDGVNPYEAGEITQIFTVIK